MISKPQKVRGLGPVWALAPLQKQNGYDTAQKARQWLFTLEPRIYVIFDTGNLELEHNILSSSSPTPNPQFL
jgi:hypothetical protein